MHYIKIELRWVILIKFIFKCNREAQEGEKKEPNLSFQFWGRILMSLKSV